MNKRVWAIKKWLFTSLWPSRWVLSWTLQSMLCAVSPYSCCEDYMGTSNRNGNYSYRNGNCCLCTQANLDTAVMGFPSTKLNSYWVWPFGRRESNPWGFGKWGDQMCTEIFHPPSLPPSPYQLCHGCWCCCPLRIWEGTSAWQLSANISSHLRITCMSFKVNVFKQSSVCTAR